MLGRAAKSVSISFALDLVFSQITGTDDIGMMGAMGK